MTDKSNENELIENMRRRLIFRSWHRGTKEMDLLLGTFAKKHVPEMSENDLSLYEEILTYSDPDLYNWMTGKEDAPANLHNPLFDKLLAHRFVE